MKQVKNPRLQFTDAELNPRLKEHNRRAERVAEKAEAARKKLPKDRKKLKRRMVDEHTGAIKKRFALGKWTSPLRLLNSPTPPSIRPASSFPPRPIVSSGKRNRRMSVWKAPISWNRPPKAAFVLRRVLTTPTS